MKPILVLTLTALLAAVSAPAIGQQDREQMQILRAQIAANRQALVAANLGLTAVESDAFWPVYRRYQAERATLDDREDRLLREFRDSFLDLGNEQAGQILDSYLAIQVDFQQLRKQYVREFRKVLPQKKVLRFMQIDNKIDTIIDFELGQIVPLAE